MIKNEKRRSLFLFNLKFSFYVEKKTRNPEDSLFLSIKKINKKRQAEGLLFCFWKFRKSKTKSPFNWSKIAKKQASSTKFPSRE